MPAFGPVRRRDLIAALRRLGFSGPHRGGRHRIMQRGTVTVILPNPHGKDIGVELLKLLLKQAGVSKRDWERVQPPSRRERAGEESGVKTCATGVGREA